MMAYRDKMVVAVKVDGKILREREGRTILPFGSEYSILLKNLESRKASVKVSVDGKDALNGRSLILQPNSSMELERFIEDSLDQGNRFRFIQKTQEIVNHRGDRIDDGFIRVEFAFETEQKHIDIVEHHHHHDYWWHDYWYHPWRTYPYYYYQTADNMQYQSRGETLCCASGGQATASINHLHLNTDEGITVRGSESHQRFDQGWIGTLDPSEVIIIRLSGEMPSGKKVETPVFVKSKLECSTCGRKSESADRFCGNCGTAF